MGSAKRALQLQSVVLLLLNSCKGCKGVPVGRPFLVSAIWLAYSGTTPETQQVHVMKLYASLQARVTLVLSSLGLTGATDKFIRVTEL